MHAHIDWRSRDCDGVMSGTYVIEREEKGGRGGYPEPTEDFQLRVLQSVMSLSFNPVTEGPGKLEIVRPKDEDDSMEFNWYLDTEEGFESKHAWFCEEDDIEEPTRRDHTAERAGY